jgi:hypothetical protein
METKRRRRNKEKKRRRRERKNTSRTDFVEIEREFSGDGTVESSFEEGGPVL